jgi:uncharacterized membrane protein YcjF (UPF0283 family)
MKWLANISGIIWAKLIGIGTLLAGFFYIRSRLKKVKKLEDEVEDLEHNKEQVTKQAEIILDIEARRIERAKKIPETTERLKNAKDDNDFADNLIELHRLRDETKDKD